MEMDTAPIRESMRISMSNSGGFPSIKGVLVYSRDYSPKNIVGEVIIHPNTTIAGKEVLLLLFFC